MGLYWVPGHAGVRGNENADKFARSGPAQRFVGPESFLGVSRRNVRRNLNHWMEKQHLALWRGRARLKCDGTRAETRFGLSAKRTSPFKSAGGVSSVDCWQPRCAHQR